MLGVRALVVLGVSPLLVFGALHLAGTAERVADPCVTWGDRWGGPQSGNGSASPDPSVDPECPGGRSTTTEAPGYALAVASLMPALGLVALGLGFAGRRVRAPTPILAGGIVATLGAFPLGLGITVVVTPLPALLFTLAARQAGNDAAEPVMRGVVTVAAGLLAATTAIGVGSAVLRQEMPWLSLLLFAPVAVGFSLVAALAWRRGAARVAPA